MGENIKEKVSKSPTNWFTRGHTNLELFSDCQTIFIWLSVLWNFLEKKKEFAYAYSGPAQVAADQKRVEENKVQAFQQGP